MNFEHRTSNIEHRMWVAPFRCEVHLPPHISGITGIAIMFGDFQSMFVIPLKIDRIPYSTFGVGCSMLDVRVFELSCKKW